MLIGVPAETFPGERRVAVAPPSVAFLKKAGLQVCVETGAGEPAGFTDAAFETAGAEIVSSRKQLFEKCDTVLQVRGLGANIPGWKADVALSHSGQVHICLTDALTELEPVKAAAAAGIMAFALDLVPRITRAQAMDVLSSQANLAGYKSVIMAANASAKIFPMMMTAAGTITPARVFVVGAGVAGLQAIATARRLGAVVSAYDVRPVAKEQVESLGARFVHIEVAAESSQDTGGYAKAMGAEFYAKQAELMTHVVAESDVVITTAAVPGQKAPILVTGEMIKKMQRGAVVVDLAAERGGNCELTRPGETVTIHGVTILGPLNVPSTVAHHASQLFAKNITTFLMNMVKDGSLNVDTSDEIVAGTLLTKDGAVVHPRLIETAAAEA